MVLTSDDKGTIKIFRGATLCHSSTIEDIIFIAWIDQRSFVSVSKGLNPKTFLVGLTLLPDHNEPMEDRVATQIESSSDIIGVCSAQDKIVLLSISGIIHVFDTSLSNYQTLSLKNIYSTVSHVCPGTRGETFVIFGSDRNDKSIAKEWNLIPDHPFMSSSDKKKLYPSSLSYSYLDWMRQFFQAKTIKSECVFMSNWNSKNGISLDGKGFVELLGMAIF